MHLPPCQRLLPLLAVFCWLAGGCSKSGPVAIAPEQVPTAVNQAFSQAPSEVKAQAAEAAQASQSQDPATAFSSLEALSHRPDLTPEQRSVAARAMAATMTQLQSASAKGDSNAQAVLHHYLITR